jgi:hypothetical protein
MAQLHGNFITGRTSFQRRAWESTVGQQGSREAGTGGRALPWHYGQGAGMGQ